MRWILLAALIAVALWRIRERFIDHMAALEEDPNEGAYYPEP